MAERRRQRRYKSEEYLSVYDSSTGDLIGRLANLSATGAMLITEEPVEALTAIPCRVELNEPILGHRYITFVAECRWNRKNVKQGWWESGYALTVKGVDAELVFYLSLSFAVGKWEPPGPSDIKTIPVEDLRATTRYVIPDPFPVYEQQSYRQIGRLVNLSRQGARLITKQQIEPGQILKCRVLLPKIIFEREYLTFDAECVWCNIGEPAGEHTSGYRLMNISRHDSVLILYLMIHYLEKETSTERVRVLK